MLQQIVGVDGVISVDLQRPGQGQEACLFDNSIPVESLGTGNAMADFVMENIMLGSNVTVVAPNPHCAKKARSFQKHISAKSGKPVNFAAYMDSSVTGQSILGNVAGADVIIVDEIVGKLEGSVDVLISCSKRLLFSVCHVTADTGTTLTNVCRHLKKEGARRVILCASHGVFSDNCMKLIDLSPIERVIVTDSLPLPVNRSSKIQQVSTANMLARIIEAELRRSLELEENTHCIARESSAAHDIASDDHEEFALE